jgi:hypothetical protein
MSYELMMNKNVNWSCFKGPVPSNYTKDPVVSDRRMNGSEMTIR